MTDETRRARRDDSQDQTQQHQRIVAEPTVPHPRVAPPPPPLPEPPPFEPPLPPAAPRPKTRRKKRRRSLPGCLMRLVVAPTALALLGIGLVTALYILFPPPRMNILLLGVDSRPGEGYVTRSDTIILTTVDPQQPYVGMLSIPRDTYLDAPGHGRIRINAAHTYGESAAPGGGPKLVAQTIANNFDVPVHRTLRMNFQGFVSIVDAAGGVDIDVPGPITDTAYPTNNYGVITIHFEPGLQHMDGERALQYARTRHSSNDFKRAERQQQVIQALLRKLLNPLNWWRLPLVYAAFATNVETDLTPIDVALLAPAILQVGPDNIDRQVLSRENSMLINANVPGDPYLLAPNWSQINPLVDRMFRQ